MSVVTVVERRTRRIEGHLQKSVKLRTRTDKNKNRCLVAWIFPMTDLDPLV